MNGVLVEFISGRKPTPPKPASSAAELGLDATATPSALFRDEFGFTKVIVAITSTGKIFGINSATGALLWGRILGLDMGLIVPNPSLHVIRSVLDGALAPVVAVVANRQNGAVSVSLGLGQTAQRRLTKWPICVELSRLTSGRRHGQGPAHWFPAGTLRIEPGV